MAEKISKQEAVRRALAHFGNDAKPTQMQGWIKSEFGIDMGTDHISTAKGDILRKAGVIKKPASAGVIKKPAPKKKPGPKQPTPQPQAAAPKKGSGIALDDILYVKSLVGRIGPDSLHKLIDVLAT